MAQIRPYREADQHSVIGLWRDSGLLRPWNDPQMDILRKQSVGADLFLVAEERQQIVAAVMGGYDGHRGWMNYLAVSPASRGQGLGRQIVCDLEKRLCAIGCAKLNLQVRTDNDAVISFYKQLGYSVDDVISLGKRLITDDPESTSNA